MPEPQTEACPECGTLCTVEVHKLHKHYTPIEARKAEHERVLALEKALREFIEAAEIVEAEYSRPSERDGDAFRYQSVKPLMGVLVDYRAALAQQDTGHEAGE